MNRRDLLIISGGQTGVDRAAWDAALELGLPQGGSVPKGRRAEDGPIPSRYQAEEMTSKAYGDRTEANVQRADVTLILGFGKPSGGTALTLALCKKNKKPHLFLDLDAYDLKEAISHGLGFLNHHRLDIINLAGPRGSFRSDVYPRSLHFCQELFHQYLEVES